MIDLSRFAKAFSSEKQLRANLVTLLSKLPGMTDVQEIHGSEEHGKDIVFYATGPLGERMLCAAVVKNSKISGSVDSNSGARTVLLQVEQALDTPYVNRKTSNEYVEHVYVFTPWECSQQALSSIRRKVRELHGQVTFHCGRELLRLFETHWADWVLFESDLLGAYVSEARKGVDGDRAVTNALFPYSEKTRMS